MAHRKAGSDTIITLFFDGILYEKKMGGLCVFVVHTSFSSKESFIYLHETCNIW